MHISIISSSVRTGRNSHRVALFFKNFIAQNKLAEVDVIDLEKYEFPIFTERLKYLEYPPESALDYGARIKSADGILIVTPEYNGGYPASLKNAIDLLYDEWYRKPIAIASVSEGGFGGSQVLTSLGFSLWKIRALMVPASFRVSNVEKAYDESGNPTNKEVTEKLAATFVNELLWCMEAKQRMNI